MVTRMAEAAAVLVTLHSVHSFAVMQPPKAPFPTLLLGNSAHSAAILQRSIFCSRQQRRQRFRLLRRGPLICLQGSRLGCFMGSWQSRSSKNPLCLSHSSRRGNSFQEKGEASSRASMVRTGLVAIILASLSSIVARRNRGHEDNDQREKSEDGTGQTFLRSRPTLEQLVDRINAQIPPSALNRDAKVTRKSIGIGDDYRIHLDVGGEGFHEKDGMVTGFKDAFNINDKTRDSQYPDRTIPLLVMVDSWANNPSFPFEDNFSDLITMQGAPLTDNNVKEIARCLRAGGEVGLWIDEEAFRDQIQRLACQLGASVVYDCDDEFGGNAGFDKILISCRQRPHKSLRAGTTADT